MRGARYPLVILALVLGAHGQDLWQATAGRQRSQPEGGSPPGHHVILVVADGLRWQEVFRGADSLILFDHARTPGADGAAARSRFWRETPAERRASLMPFLWNTVASQGQLFGNRDAGSVARVTNAMWFSYPGYNEMLSGRPDPRIDRNDYGPNPNVTVFEWLEGRDGFRDRVAVAGTWTTFRDIFNEERSGLPVAVGGHDAATHAAALQFLRGRQSRALFVGYGETDDFAHKGRYDLVLEAAHMVDRYAAELWSAAQSLPEYRGRTTLMVVADHGRGRTTRDWTDHGREVAGADETWFAIIGPMTEALGEHRGGRPVTLSQAAATIAAAVGHDYATANRGTAPAIAIAVSSRRRAVASSAP